MTHTPKQLEDQLTQALRNLGEEDLPARRVAMARYASMRVRFGFKYRAGAFLSREADVDKFTEGTGRAIVGMALAPHTSSGLANVCAWEDHCAAPCVANSGNGRYDSVRNARAARLALWIEDPSAALSLLVSEISLAAERNGGQEHLAVRLNAFSDIRWERILPVWFFERFAAVAFYDYTKHPAKSRPAHTLPDNYRLTYSVSPRSTRRTVAAAVAEGRSVAVVIATKGGKLRDGSKRPLPEVPGATVVDGDASDRRFTDPVGALVLLRRKGSLGASDPLVRDPRSLVSEGGSK